MTRKELHEMALRIGNLLRDLPVYEQAAVLQQVGVDIQADAKTLELSQLQQQASQAMAQALPPVVDEHYHQ